MTKTTAMDAPARPALRYHGAKWRLAPWILEHFPPLSAHDVYVEPFGGSAAVLLRKERSPIEVVNDLDEDVITYFRVLRDDPDALIRSIELTPFARREWEAAGKLSDDPVEQARRFYIRSYGSIAGPTAQWRTGWRRQKVYSKRRDGTGAMTSAAQVFASTSHLHTVAARLRGVFIESLNAIDLIRDYDGERTLFYVDPPYVTSTRQAWKTTAYQYELSDDDHRELAAVLNACQGMVILSGYDCDLYRELFPPPSWLTISRPARTNGKGSAVESLWLNQPAQEAIVRAAEAARAVEAAQAERERQAMPLFYREEV